MAFTLNTFNSVSNGGVSCAKIWSYRSNTDTLAAIAASGYFNQMKYALGLDDMIFVVGSDGTQQRIVSSAINASPVTTTLFAGAGSVDTADIADSAVTLAKLATGITPSHIVKFAGKPTTVGGAAAEAFAIAGVAATDLAFVQIVDNGTANVTALQAVCTLNTLTVTFSGNPGADCVFNYQILRAVA